MACKFLVLAALLAIAHGGVIPGPAATSYSTVSHAPALQFAASPAYHVAAPALHVATAHAAPIAHVAAPVAHVAHIAAPVAHKIIAEPEHYAPAHYDFEYSVHDEHTGDIKSQKESREGDVVHGSYSLIEPDGSKRTVEYTADEHSGFNAVVHREPAAHPVAVKAPVAVAAPVAHVAHVSAPVAHVAHVAAPVAHYSAPVAHYATPVAAHYTSPVAAHYTSPVAAHYTAPVAAHYAAPVAAHYSAPVAHYAAPVAHVAAISTPHHVIHHWEVFAGNGDVIFNVFFID